MSWIRLDATFHRDPDLFDLSVQERYCWIRLLCLCKELGLQGILGEKHLKPSWIEAQLSDLKPAVIKAALRAFEERGLLVRRGPSLEVKRWISYQGDPTATERQRQRRERLKEEDGPDPDDGGNGPERDVTDGNGVSRPVTVTERDVTAVTSNGTDRKKTTGRDGTGSGSDAGAPTLTPAEENKSVPLPAPPIRPPLPTPEPIELPAMPGRFRHPEPNLAAALRSAGAPPAYRGIRPRDVDEIDHAPSWHVATALDALRDVVAIGQNGHGYETADLVLWLAKQDELNPHVELADAVRECDAWVLTRLGTPEADKDNWLAFLARWFRTANGDIRAGRDGPKRLPDPLPPVEPEAPQPRKLQLVGELGMEFDELWQSWARSESDRRRIEAWEAMGMEPIEGADPWGYSQPTYVEFLKSEEQIAWRSQKSAEGLHPAGSLKSADG